MPEILEMKGAAGMAVREISMKEDVTLLAIESSCDETAAAVVEDGVEILSNVVVSQIDIFAEYGGVIPEVAARNHLEVMMPVVEAVPSP